MPDLLPVARFTLPDDWSVEDTTCVVFRVPNDQQYISQIIGLVDMLKWSRNFDHDPTRLGAATVSRTWQAALESQPVEVGCMQFELRQNPSNACQLQQSIDGGETWSLAFDYSRCGLATTTPPADGTDRASGFIRGFYQPLAERVIDLCGGTRDAAIASLTEWVRTYDPAFANPAALGVLYDEICNLSPAEQAELLTDCAYEDQYDSLSACESIDDWYDWLNCAAQTLNSTLNTWASELYNALNGAAAALGLGGLQAFTESGAAGGGGGFGGACSGTWSHTFDFVNGEQGWFAVNMSGILPNNDSVWAGTYWDGVKQPASGTWQAIEVNFTERVIDGFEITFEHQQQFKLQVYSQAPGETTWIKRSDTLYGASGPGAFVSQGLTDFSASKLRFVFVPTAQADVASEINIIKLLGIGSDPF